jgi:hypothetical protein
MKTNLILLFLLILVYSTSYSQRNNMRNAKQFSSEMQDRIAIKNSVDTFSILADQKETQKQTLLFTEDAIVESNTQGRPGTKLIGRKQIGEAFASFLNRFEVVYHINGQQTIAFNGLTAHAISYCLVTLIGNENGKKMKTTFGVYYNDDFVKKDNQWLISKRVSTFAWQDKSELAAN